MKTSDIIYMTERNFRGAIVIYGIIGVKQYYDYTMKEAKRLYKEEAERTIIVNQ